MGSSLGFWTNNTNSTKLLMRMSPRRLARTASVLTCIATFAAPTYAADWWTNMPPPVYGTMKYEVTDFGALGNGVHDDTQAFKDAIAALPKDSGGIVHVNPGTYMINATFQPCPGQAPDTPDPHCGIVLRSNMKLSMAVGAVLVVIPNGSDTYNLIMAHSVHDVEIIGGKIVGDRANHNPATGGEWGYGVNVKGSTNVLVHWTEASNFWGDGFIVDGNGTGADMVHSDYVTLDHLTSSYNRRQGLSITDGANHVLVENSTFRDTGPLDGAPGTAPMAGVDIEPDDPTTVTTTDVRLAGNTMTTNEGNGVEIHAGTSNITAVGNDVSQNHGYGLFAKGTAFLSVDNDQINYNGLAGVYYTGVTHDASLTNSTVKCNSANYYTTDPAAGTCSSGGGLDRDYFVGDQTYNITRSNNQFTP
jgi:hypothetical protein